MDRLVKAHRKYAIYSKFLDTILESEDVIQEGETRQEALTRIRRELDATADEWRREATVNGMIQDVQDHPFIPGPKPTTTIDYKKKEALEITLDNCTTLEQVRLLKDDCGKYGLLTEYVKKINQLRI